MKQYVLYSRLSRKKQKGNQYGFDVQDNDFGNFFQNKNDYVILGHYKETYSATSIWTKRKELVKAVALCKKTGATLLVTKVDRLGRHVESVAHLLNTIDIVVTLLPDADNMTKQILAVVAEAEAKAISDRAKRTARLNIANGVKYGAANAKYKARRAKTYRKNKEADYGNLREIIVNLTKRGYTLQMIANSLNDLGYTTKNGCNFVTSTISRVKNYLGIID